MKTAISLPDELFREIDASQIATLNKDELETLAGTLPPQLIETVNAGIRWFLGLER